MICINCKKECERQYEVAVVHTSKQKQGKKKVVVEELMGIDNYPLCDNCLNRYIKQNSNAFVQILKIAAFPCSLTVLAIYLMVLQGQENSTFLPTIILLVVAFFSVFKSAKEVRKRADDINEAMSQKIKRQLINEILNNKLPRNDKKGSLYYVLTESVLKDKVETLANDVGITQTTLGKIKKVLKEEKK